MNTQNYVLPFEFDLTELVWRYEDGNISRSLTEITMLKDDAEFEKWISILRTCRHIGLRK